MNVGVLALQGDVREHLVALNSLESLGVIATEVRTYSEIEAIDAMVIPGGESTTISKLARSFGLFELIQDRIRRGMPTYGSCAGMILLADPISSIAYPDRGFAKDLFFSGHVSTMMVLVLIEKNRLAKILKITGTVIMGFLLAWQHVHYTIDLLAAPVITYGTFLLVKAALKLGDEARPSN